MQQGRIWQPTRSQQTRCKTFGNCARGTDPGQGWNAAECKRALEALLKGGSTKRATEQPRHLNRDKTRKIHCNSLRNLPLHGFNKNLSWFRCSGKGKHLNLATRQNLAAKPLTTNTLQDFQRLYPWFRSMAGLPLVGRGLFLAFRLQTLLTEEQKNSLPQMRQAAVLCGERGIRTPGTETRTAV